MYKIKELYYQNTADGVEVYNKYGDKLGYLYAVYLDNIYKVGTKEHITANRIRTHLANEHYIINSSRTVYGREEIEHIFGINTLEDV